MRSRSKRSISTSPMSEEPSECAGLIRLGTEAEEDVTSGLLSSAIVLRPDSTPGLTQIVVIVAYVHTTGLTNTHKNLVPSEDLSSARNVCGVMGTTTGDHSVLIAPNCHPRQSTVCRVY